MRWLRFCPWKQVLKRSRRYHQAEGNCSIFPPTSETSPWATRSLMSVTCSTSQAVLCQLSGADSSEGGTGSDDEGARASAGYVDCRCSIEGSGGVKRRAISLLTRWIASSRCAINRRCWPSIVNAKCHLDLAHVWWLGSCRAMNRSQEIASEVDEEFRGNMLMSLKHRK
jgi:hypothetical protein